MWPELYPKSIVLLRIVAWYMRVSARLQHVWGYGFKAERSWVQIPARYSGWPGHYNNVVCSARLEISFELNLLLRVNKVTLLYFTLLPAWLWLAQIDCSNPRSFPASLPREYNLLRLYSKRENSKISKKISELDWKIRSDISHTHMNGIYLHINITLCTLL